MFTIKFKYNTLRGISVRRILSDTNNVAEISALLNKRYSYASSIQILEIEKA